MDELQATTEELGPRQDFRSSTDADYPGLLRAFLLMCLMLVLTVAAAAGVWGLERGVGIDLSSWSHSGGTEAVVIGLVVLFGLRRTGMPSSSVLRLRAFPPLLVVPLVLFAVGCVIVGSEIDNLLRFVLPTPEWMVELFLEMMNGSWESFVALVVVAPLTEELLCRGLILRGLIIQRGVRSGIVWSAFLFGIMHMNPWQFVAAFPMGIALGWLFVRSRSLWPCILLHAAFNFFGFLGGSGYLDGALPSIPGFNSDPLSPVTMQPLAFDALGFALLAVGILWMSKIFDRAAQPAQA